MKHNKIIAAIISVLAILISLISTCNASWLLVLSKYTNAGLASEPVCYIGDTYYTDLGKAIDVAVSGNSIYVIPGDVKTVYLLSGEHVLKSGVSLIMPFDGTNADQVVSDTNSTSTPYKASNGYPDTDPTQWRKSQLIFNKNAKLTIESGANFTIGACYGGTSPQGGTSGFYTEVVLDEGAGIINNGTLIAYGFIKEKTPKTTNIISYKNSLTKVTLAIYDWGGAGNALGRKDEGVFPFKQYDFTNIQVPIRFYYEATFQASWNVYGSFSGNFGGIVTLLSSNVDSLLIAKGASSLDYMDFYVKGNSNANYSSGTVNSLLSHNTNYYFSGNFDIGHLSVSIKFIKTVDIDSKDYYLPIATNTVMELAENSQMTSSYDVKFLMGTKLKINKNAVLTINGNMSLYQTSVANSSNTGDNTYNGYLTNTPAQIINNGTMYLNKGFGGYIKALTTDAKIITGSSFINYVDTKESASQYSETDFSGIAHNNPTTSKMWYITNNALIDKYDMLSFVDNKQIDKDKSYLSGFITNAYAFGIGAVEGTNYLNSINGADTINTGTTGNTYSVSLVDPNIIADSIDWSIDTNSIATIRKVSNFEAQIDTASTEGTIVLSAKLMSGSTQIGGTMTKTITITSPGVLIESIDLGSKPDTFKSIGDYFTIEPTISPSNADNRILGYSSSNTSVATIDNAGKVTAVGEGSCTITASAQDGSGITATMNLSISGTRINELKLSSTTAAIARTASSGNETTKVTVSNYQYIDSLDFSGYKNVTPSYNKNNGEIVFTSSSNSDGTDTITVTSKNGINGVTLTTTITVTVKKYDSSCVIEGTKITMADGTQKNVEDIVSGDLVQIFNHETGEFDVMPILFNNHSDQKAKMEKVLTIEFANGTKISTVGEEGFFDKTMNKYVYITCDNYADYLGHCFVTVDNGKIYSTELVNCIISMENVRIYSPNTPYFFNRIANNMLTMPGGIEGTFNIFEYDDNLKFDEELMKADIEKYGLYTYDDFAEYMSYEVYCCLPAPYFKVAIGKGILTWDQLVMYINLYANIVQEEID